MYTMIVYALIMCTQMNYTFVSSSGTEAHAGEVVVATLLGLVGITGYPEHTCTGEEEARVWVANSLYHTLPATLLQN